MIQYAKIVVKLGNHIIMKWFEATNEQLLIYILIFVSQIDLKVDIRYFSY